MGPCAGFVDHVLHTLATSGHHCFDVEQSMKIYDLPNSAVNVRMHKNVDMKVPELYSVYEQEHDEPAMREIEAPSQTAQHPSRQKEDGRNNMAKSSFG